MARIPSIMAGILFFWIPLYSDIKYSFCIDLFIRGSLCKKIIVLLYRAFIFFVIIKIYKCMTLAIEKTQKML